MIRLIVCIDFNTHDLKEAYIKLRNGMNRANFENGYETSDEWYRKELGDPVELLNVIEKVLESPKEE